MSSDLIPALYLVATPIGNMDDMTLRGIEILKNADLIACEDTRVMKKLLDLLVIDRPMSDLVSLHEHNEADKSSSIVDKISQGKSVAYASDAGMPAISDPGSKLVNLCHEQNIKVIVVPGPSSVTSAVALAGFSENSFSFRGFFPRTKKEQDELLDDIEFSKEIIVVFESPLRLPNTLKLLVQKLGNNRKAVLCREMTKKFEEVVKSDLGNLVSRYTNSPKGECVLVISPSFSTKDNTADAKEAIKKMKQNGMSSKDVIDALEHLIDLPKNTIKKIYSQV